MRKDPWTPQYDPEAKVWKVEFRIEGHRFRKRLGIRDQQDRKLAKTAAKAYWQECYETVHSEPEPDRGIRFFEAAGKYVKQGGEARFLPPLIKHFGKDTFCFDIGEDEIDAAADAVYPGRAPSTLTRQVRGPIRAVLRFAAGHRKNPSTDRARIRWLTPEEAERLLNSADHEARRKIAFLLGSGARTGEMFATKIEDLNKATQQAWIAGEQVGAGKTALAARWIELPDKAWRILDPIPETGHLFLTPKGKPYKLRANGGGQMQTAFNKARDAAGLGSDVTPHVLRHTWATWFDAATGDFGRLMDLGGWAKPTTAMRYRKLYPADLPDRLLEFGWDFGMNARPQRRAPTLRVVR